MIRACLNRLLGVLRWLGSTAPPPSLLPNDNPRLVELYYASVDADIKILVQNALSENSIADMLYVARGVHPHDSVLSRAIVFEVSRSSESATTECLEFLDVYAVANDWESIVHLSRVPELELRAFELVVKQLDSETPSACAETITRKPKFLARLTQYREMSEWIDRIPQPQAPVSPAEPPSVFENALAVCDISVSMSEPMYVGQQLYPLTPLEFAMSASILIAQQCENKAFQGKVYTYSSRSHIDLKNIPNSLSRKEKESVLQSHTNFYSTRLHLADLFAHILSHVVSGNSVHYVPERIVIFTDSSFKKTTRNISERRMNLKKILRFYESMGIKVPTLLIWNLRSTSARNVTLEQVPVSKSVPAETYYLSGYSPTLLDMVLRVPRIHKNMLAEFMHTRCNPNQ